jgi:hypothetical protein
MILEIPEEDLFKLVVKQIGNLFILEKTEYEELKNNFSLALRKVDKNFSYSANIYYHRITPPCKNHAKLIKMKILKHILTRFIQGNIQFFFIIFLILQANRIRYLQINYII